MSFRNEILPLLFQNGPIPNRIERGFSVFFHDWTEVVYFGHEFNKSTVSFSVNYVKGFMMLIYLITVRFSLNRTWYLGIYQVSPMLS